MKIQWKVSVREDKKSLIEFLQDHLIDKAFSRRKIKGFIDAGYCFVQGKCERFSSAAVRSGWQISLSVPEVSRQSLTILYEDEAIVVINKPDSTTCDERLEKALLEMGKRVHLVHRLDKDTSGVLLLAKTVPIRDLLMKQFQERTVKKRYAAIVEGKIGKTGVIENYLGPIARYQGAVKWGEVKSGHYAYTKWICHKQIADYSFVELQPETGKTHQLRVHLSGIGHPILGDHLYGSVHAAKVCRYMLHAYELGICHPITQKELVFQAPLPKDMIEIGHSLFRQKLCIS